MTGLVIGGTAGALSGLLGWAAYRYLGPVPFAVIEGAVILGSLYGIWAVLR